MIAYSFVGYFIVNIPGGLTNHFTCTCFEDDWYGVVILFYFRKMCNIRTSLKFSHRWSLTSLWCQILQIYESNAILITCLNGFRSLWQWNFYLKLWEDVLDCVTRAVSWTNCALKAREVRRRRRKHYDLSRSLVMYNYT